MKKISCQTFPGCGIVGSGRVSAENRESGMFPTEQKIDHVGGNNVFGEQSLKKLVTKEPHDFFGIDSGDGVEEAVAGDATVRYQTVQMGMEMSEVLADWTEG